MIEKKPLNLKELQKNVNSIAENTNPEDISVIVTLDESSIGPRAGTKVMSAHLGFDWESDQFRIEVKDKIIRDHLKRDNVIKPLKREYNEQETFWCAKCNLLVDKKDNFCKHCGQRLK